MRLTASSAGSFFGMTVVDGASTDSAGALSRLF